MADKGRLAVEQRAKLVLLYAETKSVTVTKRRFRQHFGTRWAPAKNTIYRLFRQFENNGTVLEPKRRRVSQVRSPENVEAVRVTMERSPTKSTRRAEAELGISGRSIQRILHSDLHLFPYKMTVLHSLAKREKGERRKDKDGDLCRRVV
ncbi:hypothetical protein L798_11158 [Zootermopsis nevadensis]|uniref:DUF4817 domain-containing protein n=1 Tax=Zootermopsis nevadensis TaxID=136037 RepID=A0A067RL13_ZOONE|nr:hypothetical protein L798_11158 [Zootermopsis nevadensis]